MFVHWKKTWNCFRLVTKLWSEIEVYRSVADKRLVLTWPELSTVMLIFICSMIRSGLSVHIAVEVLTSNLFVLVLLMLLFPNTSLKNA